MFEEKTQQFEPEWKEIKTAAGFLYLADGARIGNYSNGVLLKASKERVNILEEVETGLVVNYYYDNDTDIREPKTVSKMLAGGLILVDYASDHAVLNEENVGPYVVYATAGYKTAGLQATILLSTEKPKVSAINLFFETKLGGGRLVQWNQGEVVNPKGSTDDYSDCFVGEGKVLKVLDPNEKVEMIELDLGEENVLTVTTFREVRGKKGVPVITKVDLKKKMKAKALEDLLVPWSSWEEIRNKVGNKAQLEKICQAVLELD